MNLPYKAKFFCVRVTFSYLYVFCKHSQLMYEIESYNL
jgi:hypothetical protein